MSKNFEEEYKALADQELPDLWDRIEEGLAPRSTPKEPVKKSTKIVQFVRRYKGSLAAVVCVLLILPAAILISRNTKKSDAADQIANERFRRPVVLNTGAPFCIPWQKAISLSAFSRQIASIISCLVSSGRGVTLKPSKSKSAAANTAVLSASPVTCGEEKRPI